MKVMTSQKCLTVQIWWIFVLEQSTKPTASLVREAGVEHIGQ